MVIHRQQEEWQHRFSCEKLVAFHIFKSTRKWKKNYLIFGECGIFGDVREEFENLDDIENGIVQLLMLPV